jgi:hypothetical protein
MVEDSEEAWAGELAATGASLTEIATAVMRAKAETSAPTVSKVTWSKVGRVAEPGRYMFKFGWLTITEEDLAIWRQYPLASFTLYSTQPASEAEEQIAGEFRLGIFDLRNE